jgi:hypothetical protein
MKKKSLLQKIMSANIITLKDWLAMKPYKHPIYNYDSFYLSQCQEVYRQLQVEGDWFKNYGLTRAQLKELTCQLVSYFEDFINEIGIWKAFVDNNKQLYGYYLPFHDLSEYDKTYINAEDIAFLIWHYLTKYSPEEYIINPDHDRIMELSGILLEHFETVIEDSPTTDIYNKLFTINDNDNYFDFKSKMEWFTTESYLLGLELGKKFHKLEQAVAKEIKISKDSSKTFDIVMYTMMEQYLYQKRSSFSALNGPEWFAQLSKCSRKRREEIVDMTYWIDGKFYLKERQQTYFVFEHVLTNVQYKTRIDSFKNAKEMQPSETQVFNMHLIRWNDEYLLSGMMGSEFMTPLSLKQYKTKPLETPWILPEKNLQMMKENTQVMYENFIEFFDSPLICFDTPAQLSKAQNAYMNFHSQKIKPDNTDTFEERSKKFSDSVGKEEDSTNLEKIWSERKAKRSISLFFIKDMGFHTSEGIKEIINSLNTPSLTPQESVDLFVSFTNGYAPRLCDYLLQHHDHKNLRFPTSDNTVDVIKYLPFFYRMNSPEEFDRPYPLMTLVDTDDLD